MKLNILTVFFALLLTAGSVFGQTSWLDRPLNNWNPTTGVVPAAPRATGEVPTAARCRDLVRNPDTLSDRALTRAGWTLFGAAQIYGPVTLISGMASVDGMCRPMQYNTFVFVSNRFAGTLSPTVMDSRTDGALSQARLNSPTVIAADFSRYTSSDALCCPSQTSTVSYAIQNGRVTATDVNTQAACQNQNEPDNPVENAITGRINFVSRTGRQRNATITVRLVDVTRTNTTVIAEQQIEVTNNQQFPISYQLPYDPTRIDRRNRYAIQAEMNTQNRTIARTETNYPVLTQGNPTSVDITLVQTAGGGNQQNNSILRGTVSYRERIALPNNASITVQLLDTSAADTNAAVVAETTFSSNNRQVPIPFELGYNRNQIDLNRRYSLRAEISVEGQVRWTTDTNVGVLTQGNPTDNVQLTLVQGRQTPAPITGQNLTLSKFGTGSIQIGTQGNTFLIRANVVVKTDGNADVTVAGITGGIVFSGKLTYFDQTTLRITVESSGNADAGGEIEIRYNGRRLESITGNNLTLDGQNVTLRF